MTAYAIRTVTDGDRTWYTVWDVTGCKSPARGGKWLGRADTYAEAEELVEECRRIDAEDAARLAKD